MNASFRHSRSRGRALAAAALAAGLLATTVTPARADTETLGLYQRTARAALVARVRALSSSTRRPEVEVLEVIRGRYGGGRLTVVPHFEDRASPTPWLRREVFLKGEESVLFLVPYVDEFGRGRGPDVFSVLGAADGKLQVPTEGAGALLAAVRRFAEILDLGQHDKQAAAVRSLIRERNPHLVEAGLQECLRFRLAETEDLDALQALLERPRPDFRAGALALIAQVADDARAAGSDLPGAGVLLDRAAASSRLDDDERVRVAAVGALEAFGTSRALAVLEAVGTADASQAVRYQAQVAAYRLRSRRPAP